VQGGRSLQSRHHDLFCHVFLILFCHVFSEKHSSLSLSVFPLHSSDSVTYVVHPHIPPAQKDRIGTTRGKT
jgi:hypothetical protein